MPSRRNSGSDRKVDGEKWSIDLSRRSKRDYDIKWGEYDISTDEITITARREEPAITIRVATEESWGSGTTSSSRVNVSLNDAPVLESDGGRVVGRNAFGPTDWKKLDTMLGEIARELRAAPVAA